MDIKQLDLIEVATAYGAQLTYKGSGEYGGNCPICGNSIESENGGYSDRFTVKPDRSLWFCRTAYQDGVHQHYGDAADLVQLVEGVTYPQAVNILQKRQFHSKQPAAQAAVKTRPQNMFDVVFWNGLNKKFENQFLVYDWANEYLGQRGFRLDTLQEFGIGAGFRQGVAAITIPWYDRMGNLIGGKYRIIDGALKNPDNGKLQRYLVWQNSNISGCLYGWHSHEIERKRTLFLCEGEFNAISIFQALNYKVDVLSTGSMNAHITEESVQQIRQWEQVYVWTDEQRMLDQWRTAIGANVKGGWTSPVIDGCKRDANSMLLCGELYDFLVTSAQRTT